MSRTILDQGREAEPVPAPEPEPELPSVDELGVLRFRGSWLSLSPMQESIMRALIGRFGQPVSRSQVVSAIWPEGGRDPHGINVHIHRMRPRLHELGLVIHTLRGRGFLLERIEEGSER